MSVSLPACGRAVCALLLLLPSAALAQEQEAFPPPRADLSGGYMFIARNNQNFPVGWYLAGGVNLNRWVGVVGEATGNYQTEPRHLLMNYTSEGHAHSLMAGPRFIHLAGRFVPFAQVLAGAVRWHVTFTLPPELGGTKLALSQTDFAIQPGGGIEIRMTERLGVRVAGDYRCVIDFREGGDFVSEFRFLTGLTVQWR